MIRCVKAKSPAMLDDDYGNQTQLYGKWVKADGHTWLWWPKRRERLTQPLVALVSREIVRQMASPNKLVNNPATDEIKRSKPGMSSAANQNAIQCEKDNRHGMMKILTDKEAVVVAFSRRQNMTFSEEMLGGHRLEDKDSETSMLEGFDREGFQRMMAER